MDEQQQKKYVQMTQTPVSRLIPRLALPCIISMLVTAFYNMADTFFVGMLKSNAATGAVGVVFSLMAIIQAIGFFFGQGSGNFMSRAIGQKNYEEASDCLLYTSDAADDLIGVDLGGRRIIKKKIFSSRRRHTRCLRVSWARRCV